MQLEIEQIARVCHEVNRSYCDSIGDHSQPSWDDAPIWQQKSAIDGVSFYLRGLDSGSKPEPSAQHQSWLKQKEDEGWKYGPIKNPATKEHPCFLPYEQLPIEQKLKDYIFCAVVEAFFNASKTEVAV